MRGNPNLAAARKNRKSKTSRFKISIRENLWIELDKFNIVLIHKIQKTRTKNGEGFYIMPQGYFESFSYLAKTAMERNLINQKEHDVLIERTKNIKVYHVDGFLKIKEKKA
jgi:hypothetical protein